MTPTWDMSDEIDYILSVRVSIPDFVIINSAVYCFDKCNVQDTLLFISADKMGSSAN